MINGISNKRYFFLDLGVVLVCLFNSPFKSSSTVIPRISLNSLIMEMSGIVFGDLTLDEANATLNGEQLTAKEAEIMAELMRAPEMLVSKEYLLAKIWGEEGLGEDNYVESYMSRIRKILKKLRSRTRIVTIRGLGYKITGK